MKIYDIYKELDKIAPFESCEKWDNCGLLIGDFNDEVETIVLSLDIDQKVLSQTPNGALIISHHPLIFSGLKSLKFSEYPAIYIKEMIKRDIKLISMHTNFDKFILNRYVLDEVLGWKNWKILSDFVYIAEIDFNREEFLELIKDKFNLDIVKHTPLPEKIERVAVTTGSGASLLKSIVGKADVFLTGDIKYHEAMEAKSLNIGLIDIEHFQSEKFFAKAINPFLENLEINNIIVGSENPFYYKV
jgi:dinuclear metal center YbgI/SA1388 family protein